MRRLEKSGSSRRATTGVVALLLALVGSLAACGGPGARAPEVTNGDEVLMEGREIYIRNCAQCHGATGGGGRGVPIDEGRLLEKYPDAGAQAAIIAGGRNNMPAFGAKLSVEELDAVVRYTREVITVR